MQRIECERDSGRQRWCERALRKALVAGGHRSTGGRAQRHPGCLAVCGQRPERQLLHCLPKGSDDHVVLRSEQPRSLVPGRWRNFGVGSVIRGDYGSGESEARKGINPTPTKRNRKLFFVRPGKTATNTKSG